jgi:spore maturation protein CgeB
MQGVEAEGFFVDEKIMESGRDVMNPMLIKTIAEKNPDLLFTFLFTEEIKKETIEHITKKTKTKTFNWFADDHWRFPVYSKYWAPLFTAVSTTDSKAVEKYKKIGVRVIKTQWAANTTLYFPKKVTNSYGITFVGKKYGSRPDYISFLESAGLSVEAFGSAWQNGRVEFEKMLDIFSNSKINLNFTESPYVTARERMKLLAKLFVKKELGSYKFSGHNFIANLKSAFGAQRRQIKGRTFEVPACGGFLLTADADNLSDYYVDGKEVVIFKSMNEMMEKAKYYLEHQEERDKIAKAGYERTIKEHTYEQRFKEIFSKLF